jgi:chromosome segregation ATPase
MESLVDRYYQFEDALNDVTKALEKNREEKETVKSKKEYEKLVKNEIKLINDEIKALDNLQKEQQKERNEIKKTLSDQGFKFDSKGNISNYASQLQKLTNYANSISDPDKKESVQAQVQAIADLIERYTELEDGTIPETSMEIENLKNEIEEINKEFEENMELIEQLGDRYFDVMSKLADVENQLTMNDKLQANAVGKEKLQLMKDELKLIAQKQKLLKQQQAQAEAEAKKLQAQLKAEGVSFNSSGNIANYEALTKQLTDKANSLVGDAQDEAVEHAQKILDLIDQYMTLTDETIPGLEQSWQDYANQVEDVQDEMLSIVEDVQKKVTQAYEEEQNKRFNKLQENLKKEQDAINKAYDEDTYTKGLQTQQTKLDEISQQIAIYSRDTSEVGKARLAQLKQEYADLQEQMNEEIRQHENQLANERFDEESAALDEELAAILAPENLVNAVNQAITSGMVTVGDEVVRLDELMTNWMDESGDGLYALGGQLKTELVDNLQAAKTIMDSMGLSGFSALSKAFPGANTSSNNNTINFNQPLVNIEGNMTKDINSDELADQLKNEVLKAINDAMK